MTTFFEKLRFGKEIYLGSFNADKYSGENALQADSKMRI
jgi:hypothetical protein